MIGGRRNHNLLKENYILENNRWSSNEVVKKLADELLRLQAYKGEENGKTEIREYKV